ncbi:MAG: type II toxin-antitoxin system HigB family toxin [Deltaproteobacteria bacterium]|nr:type II toxin-antitoxin system HigB family toxin [Deltaproteobacteria bacterium]
MRLLGANHIDEFIKKHSETKNALRRWQKLIVETDYKNMSELRKTFPTADYVAEKTVFNVGGNKIRTITVIEYGIKQLIITHVLTHEEYDRNRWKGES